MKTRFHLAPLLLLASVGTAAAGIVVHGSSTGYTSTDKDWLTHITDDIDANGLGTDGWLFFGDFDGTSEFGRPFATRVESLPGYVTAVAPGANFASVSDEFTTVPPGYGIIDSPVALDGADARSGVAVATGGTAGDSLSVLQLTVTGLTTTVRVGILAGNEQSADGRWDPTSITLSDGIASGTVGDHATSPLPIVPDTGTPNNVGWVFFDIDADGTYTVSATKRLPTQGVSIGGLTFDSPAGDPDSDNDGLLDSWETLKAGNLTDLNGTKTGPGPGEDTGDFDGDGLTDLEEFNLAVTTAAYPNLDPTKADTDADEIADKAELDSNPATDPTNPDTDNDGLLDGVESDIGTNPTKADSDGDGYSDGVEVAAASDPTDPASIPPFLAGYAEIGGDWLSKGDHDIDGDGGLGTDGFFLAGKETSPGVFNGFAQPNSGVFDGVGVLPSYVTSVTAGADVVGTAWGFDDIDGKFGVIDDPLLLDGTDALSGFWIATGGLAGDARECVKFNVSGLAEGQTVRVGVLAGVERTADGRWDPTSITLGGGVTAVTAGDHALSPLPANPGGVQAGWVFFDLDTDGEYTVTATKRLDTQGAGIAGLTFDSAIGSPALEIAGAPNGTDLIFTWSSRAGKVYDLLSSSDLSTPPSTWPVWQGDIPADPSGTNIETYPRPGAPRAFFVLDEKDAPPVFQETFDGVTTPSLPAGWVAGGTSGTPATAWELGTPVSSGFTGPDAAFSGDNCVGTNLTAIYGPDAAVTLTSPAIDIPAGAATLRFRQVVEIDGPTAPISGGADIGTLRVLDASDDSELAVLEAQVEGSTAGGWTLYSTSLPAQALGKPVKFEFKLTTDSDGGSPDTFELAGWYIDDIEVFAK